ncbi:MAG: acetyl-CoA hydrolase/transferase C-terminal domain-containing protein [Eggerthellaceae bacterium]
MDWQQDYERKQVTLDQIFEDHLTGNQKIYMGGLHVPTTIINALLDRVKAGTISGIDVYGNWMNGDITFADVHATPDQFRYHTYFAGPNERTGFSTGSKCVTHIPVHFSDTNRMLEEIGLDYAVVQMTPPDAHGNCNIGPLGFEQGALRGAKHIIGQINTRLPRVFGDSHDYHVDQIDAFLLQDEPLEDIITPDPTPEECKVAEWIVDRVNDGDCIQLGIGGIINAIAAGLATKQHLGVFTEMFSDAFVQLQTKGVIDNSRKNYFPGVSVGGYSTGTQRLYDFINNNPDMFYSSYETVCDPVCIAKNDNLVSVNTAVSIDLTGQVCAESIGARQYSASGGQFDFVRGVKHSKNGRGFIAVTSVAHTKKGAVSKIVPTLAPGSAVTSLRNDLQYVVTEYGVADLRWADIPTRAQRLINIAHPDFRDELTFEAKKLGFLY